MTLKVIEANGDKGEDEFAIKSKCLCVKVKLKKNTNLPIER
jgi:hypothetical protein